KHRVRVGLPIKRGEHIAAVDAVAAGALRVHGRPLQDAPEGGGLFGFVVAVDALGNAGEKLLEQGNQLADICAARTHTLARHGIGAERKQQMLERQILVLPPARFADGHLNGLLELLGDRHSVSPSLSSSGSIVQSSGNSASSAARITSATLVSAIS